MTQSTETTTPSARRSTSSAANGPPRAAAPRSTSATRSPARPSFARPPDTHDARRAIEAAADAFPAWAADASRRPSGDLSPRRGHPREPSRRGGRAAGPRDRQHLRLRHVPDVLHARAAAPGCGLGLLRRVGEVIPSDIPGAMAMGLRQPVGVVGAIAPWNAALILSLRSITAPLVLGNTVVLKPSEWSPVSAGPDLGRDLRRGRPAAPGS